MRRAKRKETLAHKGTEIRERKKEVTEERMRKGENKLFCVTEKTLEKKNEGGSVGRSHKNKRRKNRRQEVGRQEIDGKMKTESLGDRNQETN